MPTVKKILERNIWPVIIAIITIITMFTTIGFNAEEALKKTAENKTLIVEGDEKHNSHAREIASMRTDIEVTKAGVANIKEDVSDIKKRQHSIDEKIDTLLMRSR
ncbi:MAG: hypothetical protein GY841_12410 [FCB group bacterium]|nr:hypothetical protein [FCB group bacterium]